MIYIRIVGRLKYTRNFALANIKKAISPKTIIRMAVFTRYVNLLILEASMSIPPKPY
jgi:hypothetical protein